MTRDAKRIGVLTSGGDCPGLNAVIRGVVKTAERHGYGVVGFLKGYEGLVDPVTYVPLNHKNTSGILTQGGTILGSTNKGRFAATVGVHDRVNLDPELLAGVQATVEQLNLNGIVCVGGDGSLAVAQQLHEAGIPVVGVPKTIDNDLSATAFTFGFDSAVACATDALDRLHTTAASHERIMVLEVMGRHAGWIALYAGIAGGGDVILIPEIDWTFENVCSKILEREKDGKRFTLIVVAEGVELPDGGTVNAERRQEARRTRLGGIGNVVAYEVEKRLGRETRTCILGHLQRGGPPSTFDRVLATQFGSHAVRLILEGRLGEMVCYQPPVIDSVPIIEAVNQLSQVDANSSAVQAARALGISFGDSSEIMPFDAEDVIAGEANAGAVVEVTEEPMAAEPAAETTESAVAETMQKIPVEWEAAAAYADSAIW
ncbi:MAG: 6-phosphofructokinase [Planctomycetaceae bacterium]|nr:6-phosphofructokinase [Planctomycetaceae bacterium]